MNLIKNLILSGAAILASGCANSDNIQQLESKVYSQKREINSLNYKVKKLEEKLEGIRFIVNENSIQIDSEDGYPIPRKYHKNNRRRR